MKKPLVSVIMSTYNGSKYIEKAIKSVFNQSYKYIEFIVINDNSNDDWKTEDIIKKYKDIIYIKNSNNIWLTKSLNKWIKKSNWKYIARIDDDDIWCYTYKIEKQVDFLESNLEYGMCWTNTILIDKNWKQIWENINRKTDKDIRNHLLQSNQFTHTSTLIRKKTLDELWFYNENFKTAQDYNLWLKIGTKRKLSNLQFFWVKYRIHDNTVSTKKKFKQKLNSFRNYMSYFTNYPNKIKWFMGQFVKLIFPNFIVNKFVNLNKRIERKFNL